MDKSPDQSFVDATLPFRAALRVHCYRMLGSSHDSDDLVQETLLRAWRARQSLKDPELLRPWLYRIATNACLDELKSRPRLALASDLRPAADPTAPPATPVDEPVWLEPMPDAWLEGNPDPAARYALKESVALAFVAALQFLSPVQRATLLLRDVVGLAAEETASTLGLSVAAANSALFRARSAVEEKLGGRDPSELATKERVVDPELLARYVRAFEQADPAALLALLHDDVSTTMPPSPTWIFGREAHDVFFRNMLPRWGHPRLFPTAANGQPAFAFYRADHPGAPYKLRAIDVLGFRDGKVARIDHFMTRAAFPAFGLPLEKDLT
jgi:RNA polymerase sigma-70 factor, ECF subfamily